MTDKEMRETMSSFEENYGEESLRMFTKQGCAQLQQLHRELDVKFDEIAALIARCEAIHQAVHAAWHRPPVPTADQGDYGGRG
jgi:hypothetical protein